MGAGGQKMLQNFLQSTWKTEYGKSNNISITITDDVKQDILKSPKKDVWKTLHQEDKFQSYNYWNSKAKTTETSKIPNWQKISSKDFNLCKVESSLDGLIK